MSVTTPSSDRAEALFLGLRAQTRADESQHSAERSRLAAFLGAAALVVAAVALPLFLVGVVPLTDFPAHLARVTMLSHLPLDPQLARAWEVDFRPVPNLAMDLFVPLVAPWVGPEVGLKLFMALGVARWVAGAALIWRGLWRQWAWQPLFAVFFALNATFYYGFANFHFGVGLALTAAGVWLLAPRRSALFLAAMAAVALALMFCHLMAAGIFGLLIGGFEAGRLWRERAGLARVLRSLAEGAALFLPAALAWGLLFEHGRGTGLEFKWVQNILGLFLYSSGAGAIRYNALPAAAMLAALGLAWRAGRIQIAQPALPALGLLTLAMLLCPAVALSGSIIHVRFPAVVAVLVLATGRIVVEPRWAKPILAGLIVAALATGGLEWARWRGGSATIADMRAAAAAHIPEGARLMTALSDRNELGTSHAVDLIAVDRKGFSPTFFTLRGQSTILLKPAFAAIAATDTIEGAAPPFADVVPLLQRERPVLSQAQMRLLRPYANMACDFDYLFVVGRLPADTGLPPALQRVESGEGFALFKIVAPKERGCAGRDAP